MPHDHHDHDHLSPSGHPYRPDNDHPLTHWQTMEIAVREILIEKGITTPAIINAQVEAMDKRSPADSAKVVVSHDATKAVPYAIDLTRNEGWQEGPVFAIRFDGPGRRTIATDRHELNGNTLTVTDTGFGNVLDGIAFNFMATAVIGETMLFVQLAGAAPEVERFKACAANLGV